MANEISRDIAGHGAHRGGPPGTLEVKARTGTEFRNPKNSQTSDPPGKNALLRHGLPPWERVKPRFCGSSNTPRGAMRASGAHLVSSSTSRTAAIA
jgi:hypothetical protein